MCGDRVRSVMRLAGAGCVMCLASALWVTPAAVQATVGETKAVYPANLLHPNFLSTEFRPVSDGRWDCYVDFEWSCRPGGRGVIAAEGVVHVWSSGDPDLRLAVPCSLNGRVGPGDRIVQGLPIGWSDGNPAHQWIRGASGEEVRTRFSPSVLQYAPPSVDAQPASYERSSRSSTWRRGGFAR